MNRIKLKTNNLTDQISEAMASRISAGEFTPGSQLPTALELSLEFGVSRTVVREAMSRLKSEGFSRRRADHSTQRFSFDP